VAFLLCIDRMADIEIIEDADTGNIADWVEARLAHALEASTQSIALTLPGGSTPFPVFERLVERDLDWSRVEIWPGDDRVVPEDHVASNTGKMRAIFGPAGARIVALEEHAQPPRFALAWLGMGADGHIASLFPNTDPDVADPLAVRRLTPDPLPPEAPFDRISLTIPSLLASDRLVFTLGGSADKRSVLDGAIAGDHDLPIARLLGAAQQEVTCFT